MIKWWIFLSQANELIRILSALPLFEGLPDSELALLFRISNNQIIKKSRTLFNSGEDSTKIYILLKGSVNIILMGKHIQTVKGVSSLGEIGVLLRTRCNASGKVMEDSQFLIIEAKDLYNLMKQSLVFNNHINRNIASIISKKIRQNNISITDLKNEIDYLKSEGFRSLSSDPVDTTADKENEYTNTSKFTRVPKDFNCFFSAFSQKGYFVLLEVSDQVLVAKNSLSQSFGTYTNLDGYIFYPDNEPEKMSAVVTKVGKKGIYLKILESQINLPKLIAKIKSFEQLEV